MRSCYSLRAQYFVREIALMNINTVAILGLGDMGHAVGTPLGEEFPESRDRNRTFTETIQQLAKQVPVRERGEDHA